MTTTARLIELSNMTTASATATATAPPATGEADTAARLAQLGDDIQRAQEARHAREQMEKRAHRQRVADENRLRQIDNELPGLEAAIQERQPAVDELTRRFEAVRDKRASMLNDRDRVPAHLAGRYDTLSDELHEVERALRQAQHTGSELVEGASAFQGGNVITALAPKSYRVVHPLLEEVGPGINWATPLAPMVERLEALTAERAKMTKRLGT